MGRFSYLSEVKKIIAIACFLPFLGTSFSLSQDSRSEVDLLTARLQEGLNDTDRVKTLNDLSWELMYSNPDTAIILSSQALTNAEVFGWRLGMAQCNGQLGTFNVLKGDYPVALKYYFKALKIYEELRGSPDPSTAEEGKRGIAANAGNIGLVYNDQGNFPNALEYFFNSLKINEEMGRKSGISANLGNIGGVYYNQGDYPKALEYYFNALKINQELDIKSAIQANLGNIGSVYYRQGDYPKALRYLFEARDLAEEMGSVYEVANNLGNIGNVYSDQGDSYAGITDSALAMSRKYTKALEHYKRALKIDEELGDKAGVAINLGNIGSVYAKTGDFEKAEKTLREALFLSKEVGAKEYLKEQYHHLSNLYDVTDRPAQAFEAYKLYIIYRDSMDNEENTKAQTRIEMKYEYEKATLVKEQEEKEAARLVAEKTARRDNLQYSIVLICLLVIGIVVAMLGRLSLPIRMAEGIIFFSFLILFEFLLVLADPYIEEWSGGAPGFKLLFNAGIAALIFPLHSLFEAKLKARISQ